MKTVQDVEATLRDRIDTMIERPGMFGSQMAVEMQLLLCLELIGAIRWPDYSAADKMALFITPMRQVLTERFGTSQLPASAHSLSMADFVDVLKKLRDTSYAHIEEGLEVTEEDSDSEE